MALVAATPLVSYRSNNTSLLAANTVTLQGSTANAVVVTGAAGALASSNVTATELGYLKGLASNVSVDGGLVELDYNWTASGANVAASPLSFTPLPQRAYWVEGRLLVTAEAPDYTAAIGARWPVLYSNAVGAGLTVTYLSNATTPAVFVSSSATTDPMVAWSTATLANTTYAVGIQASFTTANASQTPFAIIANTSTLTRNLYFGAGSHLSYRAVALPYDAPPAITTSLQNVYTLAPNGQPTILSLSAVDPEGNTVSWSYQVVSGTTSNTASIGQASNVFTLTPSTNVAHLGSNLVVRFAASDGVHTTYTANTLFSLNNTAPVFSNILPTYTLTNNGAPTTITLAATDPEGAPVTYSYAVASGNVGNTAIIALSSNVLTLTPSVLIADNGTFGLRFAASDGYSVGYSNIANITLAVPPATGGVLFSTPGIYSWTVPVNLSNVCVVCVGGGGSGGRGYYKGGGGGGGGLGYKNNIAVTPGQTFTVVVGMGGPGVNNGTLADGASGWHSYFYNAAASNAASAAAIVRGGGGTGGLASLDTTGVANVANVAGGTYTGDGGGAGGTGGGLSYGGAAYMTGGGGGAGGYAGAGGFGGDTVNGGWVNPADGTGGSGAGGKTNGGSNLAGGSGGGVGVYGQGASGLVTGPASGGGGGSGGTDGTGFSVTSGSGGVYGGGGGGSTTSGTASWPGGGGVVRVVWGTGRAFPSSNVSYASSNGNEITNATAQAYAVGGILYQTPGSYSWTAPANVTSVCVVCVGGGGGGGKGSRIGGGGGGGGLGYKNNIAVTPGQTYTVVVGAGGTYIAAGGASATGNTGGTSYFINTSTVRGGGGSGGAYMNGAGAGTGIGSGAAGGTYTGDGGGNGGTGGYNNVTDTDGYGMGGGGAAGYTGTGGSAASLLNSSYQAAQAGAGGGGGGALYTYSYSNYCGSGGGVGVYGQGANGAASPGNGAAYPAKGGSGGTDGSYAGLSTSSNPASYGGGNYGGGGAGGSGGSTNGGATGALGGGKGAVRIVWGPGRAFPASDVSYASSNGNETTV